MLLYLIGSILLIYVYFFNKLQIENISSIVDFNQKDCKVCKNKHENKNKLNILQLVILHIDYYIKDDDFNLNDENAVKLKFSKIFNHCQKILNLNLKKKDLIELSYGKVIPFSLKKLLSVIKDGEICVSCPSRALNSCAYECAFCPTAKGVAKSYTLGQEVFAKLEANKGNLVKYLVQKIIKFYLRGDSIDKLAMRHLGGTFHSYDKHYRTLYTIQIFYSANIIKDIINSKQLLELSKNYLTGEFDPDNIIFSKLRKPFYLDDNNSTPTTFDIEDTMDKSKMYDTLLLSLKAEQNENVNTMCRIVSYSIETRPDQISKSTMKELLLLGVTIVELGLQSPNDKTLKVVKRNHNVYKSKRAIRFLKDQGFHVHGQWMMDLPSSSWEEEEENIIKIISDDLRTDQIKIYPHLPMPNTETKEWIDSGKYSSLAEKDFNKFVDLLAFLLISIDRTTRVNRVQRDLPKQSKNHPNGYTGNQPSNLEQIVTSYIKTNGEIRNDLRTCEPRLRVMKDPKYWVDVRPRTCGYDIFISSESIINDNRIVWGYCRLSLLDCYLGLTSDIPSHLVQLKSVKSNCKIARIRELKVNGISTSLNTSAKSIQHKGIGRTLIKIAEDIAILVGSTHTTVTSSVGTRNYYKNKCGGYILDETGLMFKELNSTNFHKSNLHDEFKLENLIFELKL